MFQYWKLKQFIEERGLLQKFVAQKTDIEEVALSNILNGRQRCSLENYVKLCRFFDVPFDSFIDIEPVDEIPQSEPAYAI